MLSKFIEDCNRLLPADSARCTGLCAHSTCAQKCLHAKYLAVSANDSEETMAT